MTLRAYLDRTPSLGPGVYVDPTALVRGDVNRIRVGAARS
jgi:carbonic anhydrase/acetyltransferase-like protein (isoleucine patch superfamily)